MAGRFDGCLWLRLGEKTLRVMCVSFQRGALHSMPRYGTTLIQFFSFYFNKHFALTMGSPVAKVNYSGLYKVLA
jgi:hypothetical protein